MRTLYAYIYIFLFMVFSIFRKIKLKIIRKTHGEEAAQVYLRKVVDKWANGILGACLLEVKVIGKEKLPEGNCCFVGNHQSNMDILAILGGLDRNIGIISKKELKKIILASGWMKELKCVFIDRNDIRESLLAINEGAENLKNGHSMLIFPEGTRSKGPKMNEFKKGSLKMALKAKVPIVPLTVDGGYKYFEGNNYKMKKGVIKITVGQTIYPDKMDREELKNLSEIIYKEIEKNIEY